MLTATIIMVNNAYHYPVTAGYDALLHLKYAKIISQEGRIPGFEESRENYNPPLFYLVSGWLVTNYSSLTQQDFFKAAKIWQYVNVVLALASVYFWWQIVGRLYPRRQWLKLLFLILLLSLPVWYKTVAMFSLETWFLFTVSLAFWWLITRFLSQPNYFNLIWLGLILVVNLLSRLSALVLLPTLGLALLSLGYFKKISSRKVVLFSLTLAVIAGAGAGWFYWGRKDKGIYRVGEGVKPQTSFNLRQQIPFYTEVPFTLMMNYPIRFAPHTPLNRLVPIYYSEFWGDWWNYFSQRRFGIPLELIRADRYFSTPERIANLAWQNKVNLPLTILIVVSLLFAVKSAFKNYPIKFLLLSFFLMTWAAFLLMLFLYPSWKGDSIKASYMLSLLPIQVILLTDFIFSLKFINKLIFSLLLILLLITAGNNLIWSWY